MKKYEVIVKGERGPEGFIRYGIPQTPGKGQKLLLLLLLLLFLNRPTADIGL
jgi:hypothetical protein